MKIKLLDKAINFGLQTISTSASCGDVTKVLTVSGKDSCPQIKTINSVRFQVFTAASIKLKVFWGILPCSQTDFDRRFRGTCCLHHQGDE
jgi:hypothetical protein